MIRKILSLAFISLLLSSCAKKEEPFVQELAIPEFRLATVADSTTVSSKDIPKEGFIVIKYFSPDCEHCQEEAKKYVSKKDSLSNLKTLWLSGHWANLKDIKTFAETYQLEQTNPIYIGKDIASDLVLYFDFKAVPFAAVYKDNQLVKEYRDDLDFSELIDMNYGNYIAQPKDSILKIRRQFTVKK